MKKILFLILLLAGVTTVFAQQSIVISAGGGINNTTTSLKDKSYLGNGYNIQADAYIPFYRKSFLALGLIFRAIMPGYKTQFPTRITL